MKNDKLDNRTPHWFEDWHFRHFKSVQDRSKRNEKWIYIILVAIIGSGVLANGNAKEVASIISRLMGG